MPVTKNKEAETQVPTPAEEKKQPQVSKFGSPFQCLGPSRKV